MSAVSYPPAGYERRPLPLWTEPAGSVWQRIYASVHTDPLGYQVSLSRFSDPSGTRFGVIYLGSSAKVAFVEVVLRDRGEAMLGPVLIPLPELKSYTCADIRLASDLHLVDLTGDGCVQLRVPTDVIGAKDQTAARAWSEAFFDHPAAPDGILYPSRLNEQRNIALYTRALGKLASVAMPRLIERRDELAAIIRDFNLEIP